MYTAFNIFVLVLIFCLYFVCYNCKIIERGLLRAFNLAKIDPQKQGWLEIEELLQEINKHTNRHPFLGCVVYEIRDASALKAMLSSSRCKKRCVQVLPLPKFKKCGNANFVLLYRLIW